MLIGGTYYRFFSVRGNEPLAKLLNGMMEAFLQEPSASGWHTLHTLQCRVQEEHSGDARGRAARAAAQAT